MKLTEGRVSDRTRYLIVLIIFLWIALTTYWRYARDVGMQSKDVDGDGEDERVQEIKYPYGGMEQYVVEKDGTIFVTMYTKDGNISIKWRKIPDPTNKDEQYTFVWDEKTQQWLLDQNENGVPDEREKEKR